MTRRDILGKEYFDWLYELVCSGCPRRYGWGRLISKLHETRFVYSIDMDGNRALDGTDMRYKFCIERNYSYLDFARIYTKPCSILEMMAALSFRCEEQIMGDPDIGDRTGTWFWGMIESLGLSEMSDDNFDERYTDEVLDRFIRRKYDRNGKGGLFTVRRRTKNMRNVEIWYQMMYYLEEVS